MTIQFWLVLGLMTLFALGFILWPLWRGARYAAVSRRGTNIAIYRERLAELQEAVSKGALSVGDADALRAELDRNLLHDATASEPATVVSTARIRRWTAVALVLLVPALAVGVYLYTGDWRLSIAGNGPQAAEILLERLAKHMDKQPDDAEGWLLLARSYAALRHYPEAADAYASLNRLTTPTAETLVSEAEMRALSAGGSLDGQPAELIGRALAIKPDFGRGLWYAGLIALQRGDKSSAVSYWQRLSKQQLPDNFRTVLDDHLAQATGKAPGSIHTQAEQVAGGLRLPVSVSLDPHFAEQVQPETPVFIYAKAERGPPMPLAVVRRKVSDLPLKIDLDDSMAIMSANKLSDFDRWILTARVALHGSAEPQPGDLYAEQAVTRTDPPKTVQLTINRVLP